MAMYRLASHLRQHGHAAKCLWTWDEIPDDLWHETMRSHVHRHTRLVGISATVIAKTRDLAPDERKFFGISDSEFRARCQAIKQQAPDCVIVVGGAQMPFADKSWLKQFGEVDYFITGQGESILLYIMDHVTRGQKPRVPDITRPYVVSDSAQPYLDFSTSLTTWLDQDGVRWGEPLPLEIARGCVFRCSFCSFDLIGKRSNDFLRQRDLLRQELMHNYERFGTTQYYITDYLINESEEKINMIYDVAQSLPFRLTLTGYIRLDLVQRRPDAFKKMLDSGLNSAFFGIETLDDASARAVKKGAGRGKIMDGLEQIDRYCGNDFIGQAGMILGLPGHGPDTRYELLEWSMDPAVRRVMKTVTVQPLGISTRHPASEIDRDPTSFGYTIRANDSVINRRLHTDAWATEIYDSEQAQHDAQWVEARMAEIYPWNDWLPIWRLMWAVYLEREDGDRLLARVRDGRDDGSFASWQQQIRRKEVADRAQYREQMKAYC